MKSMKNIEKMSLEELEKVSMDGGIEVPAGLEASVGRLVDSLDRAERILGGTGAQASDAHEKAKENPPEPRFDRTWFKKARRITSVAAALALAAGFGLAYLIDSRTPKDTFDDPALAYAEIERVMTKVSGKMDIAAEGLQKSRAALSYPAKVLEELYGSPENGSLQD